MRTPRATSIIAVCLSLTVLSGCLWAPELDRVRRDIERQVPGASFHKKLALSLGPFSISVARTALKLVPDVNDAREYLKDIRSVQVAVYEVTSLPNNFVLRNPNDLQRLLDKDRWELAVKTCEDGEAVWVLYRTTTASITDLCVVALDGEDLVLVRAHGRLEELVKKAMRDNAYAARTP